MLFRSLKICNFLSIGDANITFPESGLVLISGWNEDTGRAIGAGKSALFQALCWAIYNKFPRDIKVDEIVRRGAKSCSVVVDFVVGGRSVRITRSRPSKVVLEVDGKASGVAAKDLQSEIERLVGLTYEQFLITSYFPQQGIASRFVRQTDSAAKDFLGTILSLDRVEKGAEVVKERLKAVESQITSTKADLDSTVRTYDRIHNLSIELPTLPDKEEVKKLKVKIAELTQKIENPPDTSDIDADNTLWKKRKDSISTVKVEIGVAISKIQDIDRRIESTKKSRPHLQECPSCRASLMVTPGGTSIKEFDVQAHEAHVQGLVESLLSEKEVLQRRIDKIFPLLARESEVDAALQQCSDRRSQRLSEVSGLVGGRSIAEFQLEAHTKAVKSYQAAVVQMKKISDQEVELTAQKASLESKLSTIQDDLVLWSAVKSVFSPTGFIAYSLEDVIADINTAAATYLDILSQGTATYNLSSSTSDGKAKISHQIVVNGSEVSIGSLSGGEERGVVLAVDFGIADVLVQKANAQLPSVMMLDECLEGLDAVGKEKVLDALKEISRERCIMVIDHSTEFSSLFDQVITVTKRDDISKVEV